jgi:hypothetical protein
VIPSIGVALIVSVVYLVFFRHQEMRACSSLHGIRPDPVPTMRLHFSWQARRRSATGASKTIVVNSWVGTVRRECLDRLLILGRRQLEHILRVYVRHYQVRHGACSLGDRLLPWLLSAAAV